MKVAWTTDPHLNFLEESAVRAFAADALELGAEALLLTGDIAESPSLERLLRIVAEAAALPTFFVLGNHDYYHGSVANTRARAEAACAADGRLRWLRASGPVALSADVALVGVGGWGDARLGNPAGTRVVLNDFRLIEDLAFKWGPPLHRQLWALADADAALLRAQLAAAASTHGTVWVATHVPPFREACWHEGQLSDDEWLPWFSCKAVGDALLEAADAHPHTRFEVFCGHTHSAGVASVRPTVRVHTGAAEYGRPEWTLLDTSDALRDA